MKKSILFLLIFIGVVSASSCVPQCQTTDLVCKLVNIPLQTICMFKQQTISAISSPIGGALNNMYNFIITNPSLTNASDLYNNVIYAVESFFIIILLISSIKLILSSILGPVERAKAKEDLKKVFFNMFLVWISFDIYNVAIQLSNAFSVFLAPSAQEWGNALFPIFSNPLSFVILLIALITIVTALIFAVIRWVLVYIGLFIFPVALALNSFQVTEVFGKFFLDIIIINFVVQVVSALFMRIIVNLLTTTSGSMGIFIAIGALVLMIFIVIGLYLTSIFDAISGNNWLRRF